MTQLLVDNKIVLVEGVDDEQVWSHAIRSTQGVINAFFHKCGSKDEMLKYENAANEILVSMTDGDRTVVSLRDRDDRTQKDLNGRQSAQDTEISYAMS